MSEKKNSTNSKNVTTTPVKVEASKDAIAKKPRRPRAVPHTEISIQPRTSK
jgi:hypothetical protein